MKIKELLPKHQIAALSTLNKKALDMDYVEHTTLIPEGEYVLDKQDRTKFILTFFGLNEKTINNILRFNPTQLFLETIEKASDKKIDFNDLDIKKIKDIINHRFLNIDVTNSKKGQKPKLSESGKILKRNGKPIYEKTDETIIFSNNRVSISTFIDSYNRLEIDKKIENYFNISFPNKSPELLDEKNELKIMISSKPSDILNMSVFAPIWDSCQNLYNGGYNNQLPANIFDLNSKIVYIKTDIPRKDCKNNPVEYSAYSRCIIRLMSKGHLYLDRVYPGGLLEKLVHDLTKKYFKIKTNQNIRNYHYFDMGLGAPYFDSVQGKPIKFFNEMLKDKRALALSKHLNIDPRTIEKVENKYKTDRNTYYILDKNEFNDFIIQKIKNIPYKFKFYSPFLDIEKINKDGKKIDSKKSNQAKYAFNKNTWIPKLEENMVLSEYLDLIEKNISERKLKHYSVLKSYISDEFFKNKITPEKIDAKKNDYEVIEIDGYFITTGEKIKNFESENPRITALAKSLNKDAEDIEVLNENYLRQYGNRKIEGKEYIYKSKINKREQSHLVLSKDELRNLFNENVVKNVNVRNINEFIKYINLEKFNKEVLSVYKGFDKINLKKPNTINNELANIGITAKYFWFLCQDYLNNEYYEKLRSDENFSIFLENNTKYEMDDFIICNNIFLNYNIENNYYNYDNYYDDVENDDDNDENEF